MTFEITISIISAALVVPALYELVSAIVRTFNASEVRITDADGKIIKVITAENVRAGNLADLKQFHKDLKRRIANANRAT